MTILACIECTGPMPPKKLTGPRALYCSTPCRRSAEPSRDRESRNARARARTASKFPMVLACINCAGQFESGTKTAKFCSKKCSNAHLDEFNPIRCANPECSRGVRAKGLCNMHYRQVLRDEGRIVPDPWSDRRRDAHHARRARMAGAKNGDKVMLAAVRERDGGVCGICREPVDESLEYPDPMSSSVDHIIPIIKGGEHSMANCQLAHLVCNLRKSDSLPD